MTDIPAGAQTFAMHVWAEGVVRDAQGNLIPAEADPTEENES